MENKNHSFQKFLFIFDMDHTIINLNSDYEIRSLLSDKGQKEINNIIESNKYSSWIHTMQLFFNKMNEENIKVEKIKEFIQKMELTKGMKELFNYIKYINSFRDDIKIDVIIISGANTKFVEWVIKANDLKDIITDYFSFKCNINENLLELKEFHLSNCESCDPYLCKQKVINDYLLDKKYLYNKYFFCGDGYNDYCACLAISKFNFSIVYVREGYGLYNCLYNTKLSNDKMSKISSRIVNWISGDDILNDFKKEF